MEEVRKQVKLVQRYLKLEKFIVDPYGRWLYKDILAVLDEYERKPTPNSVKLITFLQFPKLKDVKDCQKYDYGEDLHK